MAEKTLKVEETKTEKGVYYNIFLKPKEGKDSLQIGDHVFLEKTFAEGREKTGKFGNYFIVQAKYAGSPVGFLLSAKEHEEYKNVGAEGTKIKVSLEEKRVEFFAGKDKKTKQVRLVPTLKFELA